MVAPSHHEVRSWLALCNFNRHLYLFIVYKCTYLWIYKTRKQLFRLHNAFIMPILLQPILHRLNATTSQRTVVRNLRSKITFLIVIQKYFIQYNIDRIFCDVFFIQKKQLFKINMTANRKYGVWLITMNCCQSFKH